MDGWLATLLVEENQAAAYGPRGLLRSSSSSKPGQACTLQEAGRSHAQTTLVRLSATDLGAVALSSWSRLRHVGASSAAGLEARRYDP
jgi:hypothetical protein